MDTIERGVGSQWFLASCRRHYIRTVSFLILSGKLGGRTRYKKVIAVMDETDGYTWIDQMRMRWNGIYARQELDMDTAVSGDSTGGPKI